MFFSTKPHHGGRNASHTKSGPGRKHLQGKPGASTRGKGFKGATFAPARPLSSFHPVRAAELRAMLEARFGGRA